MRGKLALPTALAVSVLGIACGSGTSGSDARPDAPVVDAAGPPDEFCEFYCAPEPAIVDAGSGDPDAKSDCPEVACNYLDCPAGCELA